MSVVVDVVKEAGPYVVGVAGLWFGFANARLPGREARHHARVETLYPEMLDALDQLVRHTVTYLALTHPVRVDPDMPVPDPKLVEKLASRIEIFASRPVREKWNAALQPVLEVRLRKTSPSELLAELDGSDTRPTQVEARLWETFEVARTKLVAEIRRGLAVPRGRRQ
ncbi:hypothetical protein AB0E69_02550 [Kribbella sp. NPDC026611]|uniref:hypothetical protein n=1 Tax=Kribbella sp. NPDC026611 TaxID=3154911 RepID=UPI0033D9776B